MTLKELRRSAGKSVKEVAEKLCVTPMALNHYENGRRKISLEQVLALVSLYDVSAEEVISAQLNSLRYDL